MVGTEDGEVRKVAAEVKATEVKLERMKERLRDMRTKGEEEMEKERRMVEEVKKRVDGSRRDEATCRSHRGGGDQSHDAVSWTTCEEGGGGDQACGSGDSGRCGESEQVGRAAQVGRSRSVSACTGRRSHIVWTKLIAG